VVGGNQVNFEGGRGGDTGTREFGLLQGSEREPGTARTRRPENNKISKMKDIFHTNEGDGSLHISEEGGGETAQKGDQGEAADIEASHAWRPWLTLKSRRGGEAERGCKNGGIPLTFIYSKNGQ